MDYFAADPSSSSATYLPLVPSVAVLFCDNVASTSRALGQSEDVRLGGEAVRHLAMWRRSALLHVKLALSSFTVSCCSDCALIWNLLQDQPSARFTPRSTSAPQLTRQRRCADRPPVLNYQLLRARPSHAHDVPVAALESFHCRRRRVQRLRQPEGAD